MLAIEKKKKKVAGTGMKGNIIVSAAEAKGFKWAILLSQELNLRKVIMKETGDPKVSIGVINKALKGERPISIRKL